MLDHFIFGFSCVGLGHISHFKLRTDIKICSATNTPPFTHCLFLCNLHPLCYAHIPSLHGSNLGVPPVALHAPPSSTLTPIYSTFSPLTQWFHSFSSILQFSLLTQGWLLGLGTTFMWESASTLFGAYTTRLSSLSHHPLPLPNPQYFPSCLACPLQMALSVTSHTLSSLP